MVRECESLTKGIKIYEMKFKIESNNYPPFYQKVRILYHVYDNVTLDDLLKRASNKIKERNPNLDITKLEYIDGELYFK